MTISRSKFGGNSGSSKELSSDSLLGRVSNFLRNRRKTVRELNDGEFLALFDIPAVRHSLGQGYNLKSMAALIDYYRQRVGDDWLEPPCQLADLGINTATASDTEILNRANEVLSYNFDSTSVRPIFTSNGDVEWCFSVLDNQEQLLRINRHTWWPLLGHAYLRSADERYARAFARQLSSWINANFPIDEDTWSSPIWSSRQVAYRLRVSWIPAFGMFYESPHFTTSRKLDMLRCIFDQARMLKQVEAKRNPLLDGGLVSAGISFPELSEASHWRRTAVSRFRNGVNGIESDTSDHFWSWNVLASTDRELAESA